MAVQERQTRQSQGAKDEFDKAFGEHSAYYVGKNPIQQKSTEILSMGVEKLFEDPGGFAAKDPEYCKFILGILDGRLRSNREPDEVEEVCRCTVSGVEVLQGEDGDPDVAY